MIGGRDDTKSTSQRRQCWECARRRLVCDNTRPSCTKCTKSGVECPGYGKSKPLKWLEPGQVLSQRGRRRTPENEKQHKEAETKSSSTLSDSGKQVEDPIKPFDPSLVSLARVNNAYDAEVELIPRVNLIEETAEIVHSIHYCKYPCFPK